MKKILTTSDGYMPKLVPRIKSEFKYPELQNAERNINSIPKDKRIIRGMKDSIDAFGKHNMSNPKFIKELRRFQEKYEYKGLV
jgi:hypothetical protein